MYDYSHQLYVQGDVQYHKLSSCQYAACLVMGHANIKLWYTPPHACSAESFALQAVTLCHPSWVRGTLYTSLPAFCLVHRAL